MPNPSGPDRDETPDSPPPDPDAETTGLARDDAIPAEQMTPDPGEQPTEVFASEAPQQETPERRFTAPGFDAGQTDIIQPVPEEPTEAFDAQQAQQAAPKRVAPQLIPPRLSRKLPVSASRSRGWVMALILIIVLLAAVAILGAVWLTGGRGPKVSQEDRVRDAIENFDVAVQNGDLTALRSMTCGALRDGYVNYTEQEWDDTYRRVSAAKQYPVVASIDEVVVNGDHAEANVTAFMAYAPQTRSTRSFDLQFRDDQWKICQSSSG
jgi:hypothetical protein